MKYNEKYKIIELLIMDPHVSIDIEKGICINVLDEFGGQIKTIPNDVPLASMAIIMREKPRMAYFPKTI